MENVTTKYYGYHNLNKKKNEDLEKTNEFSNLGELHRSLSDEEKALIQISVKNTYNDFISHVI